MESYVSIRTLYSEHYSFNTLVCFPMQAYGFIDVFSGEGFLANCIKANGVPVARFDIRLGQPQPGKQDPMNLLDDAGFAFFNGIGIFLKFKGNFNTSSFKILAGDVLVLPEFTFRFIFFY